MAKRLDTPEMRRRILDQLKTYPTSTYRISRRCGLTTKQAYPILRRMETSGLLERPHRDPWVWKRKRHISAHARLELNVS